MILKHNVYERYASCVGTIMWKLCFSVLTHFSASNNQFKKNHTDKKNT